MQVPQFPLAMDMLACDTLPLPLLLLAHRSVMYARLRLGKLAQKMATICSTPLTLIVWQATSPRIKCSPVRELSHEIDPLRTHAKPRPIVQRHFPVQYAVHDFSNSLLMALLQCCPAPKGPNLQNSFKAEDLSLVWKKMCGLQDNASAVQHRNTGAAWQALWLSNP